METCRKTVAVALSAVIIVSLYIHPVLAQGEHASTNVGLSPYWEPVVGRWEDVIVHYGEKRRIDPDLVASVIWKESRGMAHVRGPTGAVGLMCVKPFPWRPSADALENPWTNVAAGTRTLAQILRDGRGDVYYALAAYNGGWEQIHLRVTRRYAADVLGDYVRAVAVKHGLPAEGDWIAILSVEGLSDNQTVTVLGPHRSLARYTERPLEVDIPSVPEALAPHATPVVFTDERGRNVRVNLWLINEDGSPVGTSSTDSGPMTYAGRTSSSGVFAGEFGGLPD